MALSSMTFAPLAVLLLLLGSTSAHLSPDFYAKSCPKLYGTVKAVVQSAIAKEKRMGASLLRLLFHDCFVQGCDASILLDDTPTFRGEKTAAPNNNSVRGFDVVDKIKAAVEEVCPGVVSCADLLVITARDSVVILGGPFWEVTLGRRDSTTASFTLANNNIPPPTSSLSNLINKFAAQGLSTKDMVALSGAHTIGKARCINFRSRIYNETNINRFFAKKRQANCPKTAGSGDNNLAPLDVQTPTYFDNDYYQNLIHEEGLLHSDQVLYNGGCTDSQVKTYSISPGTFYPDFVIGMIKMANVNLLVGREGQIRKNCRRVN